MNLLLLIYIVVSFMTFVYSMLITSDIPINYTESELLIMYLLGFLTISILALLLHSARTNKINIISYVVTFLIISLNFMKITANLKLENTDKPTLIYESIITLILLVLPIISYILKYKHN